MPRPSPNERRKIEARKRVNEKIRLDAAAHDERVKLQVEGIINGTLARTRGREAVLPDLPELLERLEEARLLAMASGQANAAVAAVMAEAKLCGFVIDKSAVAHADFRMGKTKEDVINDLREAIGDGPTQQFLKIVESMRRAYKGDGVIEGSARRLGNGSDGDHDDA
jgi:hypothetical protein